MNILFKLPTRSRPEKFFLCLENICQNLNDKINYRILVSYDDDDETMRWEKIKERIDGFQNEKIILVKGISKNKIAAVNRDINEFHYDWDILIATADDMWFIRQGFDDVIREDMRAHFPDLDGMLHYNDGNQKTNVMTMSIMGRKYYNGFKYVYHTDYQSLWSDMEATEVARRLGKYKYMGDEKIIFRHLHPAWGLSNYDEQYKKSESMDVWEKDLKTYSERQQRNYDLTGIINPL